MILEIILFVLSLIFVYHIYKYKKLHKHFDKCGIKYNPGVPIFGNSFCSTFGIRHMIDDLEEVYREFPDERYVGFIEGSKPVILVRDPELMKQITIKDFDHFINRKDTFPKEIEPLLGNSLLSMKDHEWRVMRARLTGAFSSSKMRLMQPSMTQISHNIVEYLKEHQSEDIDVIDVMRRYATDVTASTGFSLQLNSLKDRHNDFYITGETAVHFTAKKRLYYFVTTQFPAIAKLMEFLGVEFLSTKGTNFFRRLVSDSIEYRKKHNVIRPDFINLLMEASEDWKLDELTGQIYFGFLASFESLASTLTLCIHELSLHPVCEDKLYQEIRNYHEKHNELQYEDIYELKYMDWVLNETMRKFSVAVVMDRVCIKTYTLPPSREGGQNYKLQPKDLVYNSVNAVHMDPQYHPEPHTFDPERFSEGNRSKIKPFTYMPFGMGPRNCLGMRYSTLSMKILLYHLVLNFKITACNKTPTQIRLQPGDFVMKAVGESYVRFESRI